MRWCVDIRYIEKHRIQEIKGAFYVITVMDAFSRAILSSDIFQSQDLACVLIVLYAAVEQFGAPHKLISDNGGVFRAKQLLAICEADETPLLVSQLNPLLFFTRSSSIFMWRHILSPNERYQPISHFLSVFRISREILFQEFFLIKKSP